MIASFNHSPSHSLCAHLAGDNRQALAVLTDDQGRETFLCAPCLADQVENLLKTHSPDRISRRVVFNRCGHYPGGGFCETCYCGVAGCLSLFWSHLRLRGDSQTSNRLLKLVREWARVYGPTHYIGRQRIHRSEQTTSPTR